NVAVAGVKMPRLIMSKLWNHHVPLPPLSEQHRIVELLDQADDLRKNRVEADKYAARILPALFYRAFGDPISNPKRWSAQTIGAVAGISYGISDQLDTSLTSGDGTRILTISNVSLDGEIDTSVERYSTASEEKKTKAVVQHGDLFFNWRNGSAEHVGKTAIW